MGTDPSSRRAGPNGSRGSRLSSFPGDQWRQSALFTESKSKPHGALLSRHLHAKKDSKLGTASILGARMGSGASENLPIVRCPGCGEPMDAKAILPATEELDDIVCVKSMTAGSWAMRSEWVSTFYAASAALIAGVLWSISTAAWAADVLPHAQSEKVGTSSERLARLGCARSRRQGRPHSRRGHAHHATPILRAFGLQNTQTARPCEKTRSFASIR